MSPIEKPSAVEITTYYLEMTAPRDLAAKKSTRSDLLVAKIDPPMPELNRFFYTAIGGEWYWLDRLSWTARQRREYVGRPGLETWMLSAAGVPAGYVEMEAQAGGEVEIVYFGLLPRFIGQGLGGHLLTAAVERAWQLAWFELAEADAAKAHRAIWTLVADPARALPLLRVRLKPTPRLDPQRMTRLVADLDSDEFTVRDKATRELRKLGEVAGPALRQALKNRPTLELRRRATGLLNDLDAAVPSSDRLRDLRALAVLEYMARADCRQLLRRIADGAPASRLTGEAKASLQRLAKRGQPNRDR